MKNKNKNNPADFYNGIAGEYDEMFDFQSDLEAARGVVTELKKQFHFEKALDIGCGTGSFTIALAQSGAETVGMDLSKSMVEAARQNSFKYDLQIDFVNSAMTDMAGNLETHKFDLIMCMGNTLPHLLSAKELDTMLSSCKQLLNPEGHLVLNLLNYDRVLDQQERIVGITRNKNHEFIRFYDFEKPFVDFNILEVDWSDQPVSHNLSTTRLYPYRLQELKSALDKTGFDDIAVYEGLKFQEYNLSSSKSIMITAKRV